MTNKLPALGDLVRDRNTGFQGIAEWHATPREGRDHIYVQPCTDEQGQCVDGQWIDIDHLEVIEAGAAEDISNPAHTPPSPEFPVSG